jgi:LysM repeat protein/predicted nucleic acid-binding Zn ribbon protein
VTEEPRPQRHCPQCGLPVAQRAETCLMCGANLKERKKRTLRLPPADLWLPLLIVGALALLWLWKPWQVSEPQAMVPASATPSATPTRAPSATYDVVPTATPLYSPTPPPTATLPPNQTRHEVQPGETISAIAKIYGTTTTAILQANGLKESSIISVGQELVIPLPVADTATPTPTLTPSPTPFVYKIKSGETLSAIASRFNTTVEVLMEANNIADATLIRVGTELTIVQPPDFTATMAYETYEVEQGDTLYTISAEYELTIAQLKEINSLTSDQLRVGQELRIPVGTATPTPTLTPIPTLTPTPGPARPAPALLGPPDETAFEGADTVILLNWASVGILGEDEWYVVRARRTGLVVQLLPLVWTKATSWRLPADLYIEGLDEPQRFYWQVSVMQQTGLAEDGTPLGEQISASGEVRTFTWK